MATGEVNQGGGIPSGMSEALERLLETTKGNPRAREEGIKEIQDQLNRARGRVVIGSAAPAIAAVPEPPMANNLEEDA